MNETVGGALEKSEKDILLQQLERLYPEGLKDLKALVVNGAYTEDDFYNMLDPYRLQIMLNAIPSSRQR